uniref:Ribosomal protein L13 n=1 Tax=Cyanidium sp. THAL103 TaxID=3027999 RepID=A0A9Y1I494_9RHOD|nr:ribosomal protein L13 [Cyanidium sp. THAL103]
MKKNYLSITKYKKDSTRWYLVDAKNKILGRLISKIIPILTGKNKPTYCSSVNASDRIIIINASKISISGNKEKSKIYYKHSGRPGGMKTINFQKLKARFPAKIIEIAIKGMLPKGRRGRELFKNLRIYDNEYHNNYAQQPELIN